MDLPTLKLRLQTVTDWHGLGLQLDVPPYQLEKFDSDYPRSADRKMAEVLTYWLRNCPKERLTWQTIAAAVETIGHGNLARTLRSEITRSRTHMHTGVQYYCS